MKTLPTPEDVKVLSEEIDKPCLIPLVIKKEELKDPGKVYLGLRKKYDSTYLLESLAGPKEETRYSIIGCKSLLHLKIQNNQIEIDGIPEVTKKIQEKTPGTSENESELEILKKVMLFDEMKFLSFNLPRYLLGVTGYVSYDFVQSINGISSKPKNHLNHPILEFMLPSLAIVFDHEKKQTYYSSLLLLTDETNFEKAHSRAIEELRELTEKKLEFKEEDYQDISVRENISEDDFKDCVGKIRKYIRMGDIIQAVLSRRIDLDPCPPLGKFYSELREINPSPYMFFLDFPGQSIIGSSPEALVRVQENKVLTRPIAGTRRRGKDATEDAEMEEELLSDEKERAEHVMLVDLARNDIGKISKFGSIETPEFMEVEKYGDVQHIVSTVVGELESNVDAFDTLRSVFPAGTVSGAPKVRAMEIIEELEPSQRGIYSGAVGTFSYTGDADFAITIRSLTASNGKGQIQVGAGIVADSVPWKEYYETKNKAQSLLRAAGVKNASGSDR